MYLGKVASYEGGKSAHRLLVLSSFFLGYVAQHVES